jgi:hypothetical protein
VGAVPARAAPEDACTRGLPLLVTCPFTIGSMTRHPSTPSSTTGTAAERRTNRAVLRTPCQNDHWRAPWNSFAT